MSNYYKESIRLSNICLSINTSDVSNNSFKNLNIPLNSTAGFFTGTVNEKPDNLGYTINGTDISTYCIANYFETSSATSFTTPSWCKKIRAVLIGAGGSGSVGQSAQNTTNAATNQNEILHYNYIYWAQHNDRFHIRNPIPNYVPAGIAYNYVPETINKADTLPTYTNGTTQVFMNPPYLVEPYHGLWPAGQGESIKQQYYPTALPGQITLPNFVVNYYSVSWNTSQNDDSGSRRGQFNNHYNTRQLNVTKNQTNIAENNITNVGGRGGGGGGGAFVYLSSINVSPNTGYNIEVGSGKDSTLKIGQTTYKANKGVDASTTSGGAGGSTTTGVTNSIGGAVGTGGASGGTGGNSGASSITTLTYGKGGNGGAGATVVTPSNAVSGSAGNSGRIIIYYLT